jgi:DNA-directed RNA polymerase specialized sigma24 family protein
MPIPRAVDGAQPLHWDHRRVLRHRRRALVEASVPYVYGAALAAAEDPDAAAAVTEEVMVAAAAGRERADARSLVARVVVRAVRTAPHAAFAPMPAGEREVVALARLAGYDVAEIAETLGIAPAEARCRMTSGVRALAQAVT